MPGARTWSRKQILDVQGSAMLFCPELAPHFVDGVDPETGIRNKGDNGATPHGIVAGWIWLPWLPWYPRAKREIAYRKMLEYHWTHAVLDVGAAKAGDPGYHSLRPVSAADAAAWGGKLTDVINELEEYDILPVWEGVSPTVPLAPGLDPRRCKIAVDDWDNSSGADCRIKALAETFPTALLIYELPAHVIYPTSDGCGPTVDNNAGGAWIRSMQRAFPRFVGVMLENNVPDDGIDAVEKEFRLIWPFWRDVLIYANGENDWYWAFWENRSREQSIKDNDELRRRFGSLIAPGWMSEETPHQPPADEVLPPIDTSKELDLHECIIKESPGDLADWPITTTIRSLEVRDDDVYIDFDARDRWPESSFGVQFSLGMCLKVGGQWYASAPIELWKGKPGGGGGIFQPGQIPNQWFYDAARWGQMSGHQPQSGEQIGLFVAQGDLRNNRFSLKERSNVVLVTFP